MAETRRLHCFERDGTSDNRHTISDHGVLVLFATVLLPKTHSPTHQLDRNVGLTIDHAAATLLDLGLLITVDRRHAVVFSLSSSEG